MRGPFIVALCACYESVVREVARGLQGEMGVPIALSELKGESTLKIARRYFDLLLKLPLDQDKDRYDRLLDLYQVRNGIAHANGLREGMPPEVWLKLRKTLSRHGVALDDSHGMVILPRSYVEGAYADVNASLISLVTRARLSHPRPRRPTGVTSPGALSNRP